MKKMRSEEEKEGHEAASGSIINGLGGRLGVLGAGGAGGAGSGQLART